MLRLAIRFPAGHYHATPWGRHVNEGDVEWPPSPWRLCRALLATGFAKLGWTAVPPEGRALVERLAATPPVYHLPVASTGHTRHYMPLYKNVTAKVIDAFAFVGRSDEAVLGVSWDVDLSAAERELFAALVERIGYLGRAESWVTAEVVDALPHGLSECRASEIAPGPRLERVALLAPLDPGAYAEWRGERIAEASAARGAGGKAPSKAAEKKEREKLEALYPPDLLAALMKETGDLQREGWSQPPGSRWLSYWREREILSATPRPVPVEVRRGMPPADTALLALASDTARREVLPRLEDGLLRMEALHKALVNHSDLGDGRGPSPSLCGRDATGAFLHGHAHAWLLPLSLAPQGASGSGGRINHVLVHAKMGFDDRARSALGRVREAYAKNIPKVFVTLVGVGQRADFEAVVPCVREARVWRSAFPFVPPRHLKARGASSLEAQVQAELASRGLPPADRIEVELEGSVYVPACEIWRLWSRRGTAGVRLEAEGAAKPQEGDVDPQTERLASRWRWFRRERLLKREQKPPVAAGFGLRITFTEPIRGPIALGYASHFGLGAMEPES